MATCPQCGKTVSESDAFCPDCGRPLRQNKYCPHCGAGLSDDLKYCPSCGGALDAAAKSDIPGYDKDKKLIAGIFAIVFGALGVHYFYLGKTTAGIITIVLSICSCGIWHLLMLVQGIIMLLMDDDSFYAKYVNTDKTFPLF